MTNTQAHATVLGQARGQERFWKVPHHWNRLSRTSRQLLQIGAGLIVLGIVGLGLMIWQLRANAVAEARHNVRTLAMAIAEQTSRSLQATDVVLEDLRRQIADRRLMTVDAFKADLANEDLFRLLRNRADILPQVEAFTIIAADGALVNSSRQWPAPPTDLSGRDYVSFFSNHDITTAFVSDPVRNADDTGWTSYIVRRINAPSGRFLGTVLAAVDLNHFCDFFRALVGQAGTTVTLLRRDGTLLASYPPTRPVGTALPPTFAWHEIVDAGGDVFEPDGMLAPGPQIAALQPLKDYSLVINVEVGKATALARWVRVSTMIGLASLFAVACVLVLIRGQLRQLQRTERSEHLLASRNATLELADQVLRRQATAVSEGRALVAAQSATLQATLAHMNQGIIMVDANDRVVVCSDRAAAMLDLPVEFVATRPSFGELTAFQESIGEFAGPAPKAWAMSSEQAIAGPQVYERTRPDGTVLEIQTVAMAGGGLVRTYTDVTERRRFEQQVRFLARHDGLTGLLNRTAFHERFEALIAEAAGNQQQMGVFYIDLDGFKLVNDTYGHATGDQLLVKASARLQAAIRDTDTVARMGGDEFATIQLFSGGCPDTAGRVADLAQRVLASVAEPYRLGDIDCSVNLSIGVALYPDHATDPAELLQRADMALYRAKAEGKGTFRVYDARLDHGLQASFSLEKDLAQAVELQQLHLEYQPILEAGSLAVIRHEALLRWTHPVLGPVAASDFIPIAEQSGLIVPIGAWVLQTACAAAATWSVPVELSVNLSPVQFARGDLALQVEQVLKQTGLPPGRLNLEITEGMLLDDTTVMTEAMTRLRAIGVRFSLDDFGTAYAGLTYLRRFSFDVLKIDRSFVQDATRAESARGILGAIQAIGAAYRLQVVAEGIETPAELALVRELGCDHVQGYLLGRPEPLDAGGNGVRRPSALLPAPS